MQAIYDHAEACYPQECCGVVTAAGVTVPLDNVADNPHLSFKISPKDYLMYVQGALFVYHSHPDGKAVFSSADNDCFDAMQLPLMVVSWPYGEIRMVGTPGTIDSLVGRPFIYGVYDCYSLARDYYMREFEILVPQITRPRFGWWESGKLDPFTKGILACGMVDSEALLHGDIILFALNGSKVSNHIGIYIGGNKFMHHGLLALSEVVDYDQRYRDATTRTLRHADRS